MNPSGVLLLLGAWLGAAQAQGAATPVSGQVRLQWDERVANTTGPLAAAHAMHPGAVALPGSGATLEAELRASGRGLAGVVTLQQQHLAGRASAGQAWVNELYASHDAGAWQFSAGKKIVAWDVGYGFRPNDVVQQEERLSLVDSTPQGRPLLVAEHFSANTAWSLVWVNPTATADALGGKEPALAARFYRRADALDWYAFARAGVHSGGSVGAAAAWVASEALELHGSLRLLNHATSQALLGGSWTSAQQVSVLAEAWRDGTSTPQRKLMLRASWTHEGWKPALDLLYTPADQGRVVTASLTWQGDRVQVQGGVRTCGGPAQALLAQGPVRRQAYVAATLAF